MKKKISRRARITYFGLLLCLGIAMVVGPAMAGSITFTSVGASQSFGAFYQVTSPGPNFQAVNGNPASVALTNTTVTCISTSVACGVETLTLSALVSGLSVGDLISIGLDGTWSGGATTTLQWQTSSFGTLLDTGVQNATSVFNFLNGPIALTQGGSIPSMIATLTINGLGAGRSIVLPNSAIVNAVTPSGVPEPTSVALMAAGLGAMGLSHLRRRRRQKS